MGYKTDVAKGIGGGTVLLIVVIVIGLLVSGGLWLLSVATSGVKGQGDATKINNSAENWTAKQELFHEKYQAFEGAKAKIAIYKAKVAANPGDKSAQTELDGMISQCINYVTAYNKETESVLSRDWKDSTLPYNLSTTSCN